MTTVGTCPECGKGCLKCYHAGFGAGEQAQREADAELAKREGRPVIAEIIRRAPLVGETKEER